MAEDLTLIRKTAIKVFRPRKFRFLPLQTLQESGLDALDVLFKAGKM